MTTMIKKTALPLAALALLAAPAARAEIGVPDAVPAATLLLPYFEVDLANTTGRTTLMSINNASASATLARVTLWTDLGVPTLSFDLYLTGFDVHTINLRDVLNGALPVTASDGQDPTDTISPQGPFSQDINFASCSGPTPDPSDDLLPPTISAALAAEAQAAHTGQAAATLLGGNCGGRALGDSVARGYVTVDVSNQCTTSRPGDPGYFVGGGAGVAGNRNIIWGDYFHVDPENNFAQGDALVHVEASDTDPETSVAGEYTFYGRYVAWTAADNREPLGTTFAARFLNGGAFTGGTDLLVWRDSKVSQASFACGTLPTALAEEDVYAFDEQENAENVLAAPGAEPFPASANRVTVDSAALPISPMFGWLYLNLNHSSSGGANPPEDTLAAQAWVTYVMDAEGRFSVSQPGTMLQSATASSHGCIAGGGPPCP